MATTQDDTEENPIPGSTPDDYVSADTPEVADVVQTPKRAAVPAASEENLLSVPDAPDPSELGTKPTLLQAPIKPTYLDPSNPENDYANVAAEDRYLKQVDAYNAAAEKANAAAEFAEKRKAYNQGVKGYSRETGLQYQSDDQGILRPKIDEVTGSQAAVERMGPVEYDEKGRTSQVVYNQGGKAPSVVQNDDGTTSYVPEKKIVDPDAGAKIGTNPNDPSDTNLYRQNQNKPWEVIDPQKGMLSTDPAVAIASAKHLHKNELANTLQQRTDLGLQIQQIRAGLSQKDTDNSTDTETGEDGSGILPSTISSGGLTPKARAKAEADVTNNSDPAPKPTPKADGFFGSNQEANAQALAQWNEGEKQRQAMLDSANALISADDQIKDARTKMLDLSIKANDLKKMGPGGYLKQARANALSPNALTDTVPVQASDDGSPTPSPVNDAADNLQQTDAQITASSQDIQQRMDALNAKRQAGGTAADHAEWDKEASSIQADTQGLQKTIAARDAKAQQIQNAASAQAAQAALSEQQNRNSLRNNPELAPAADALDNLDADAKARKAKLDATTFSSPESRNLAYEAFYSDIQNQHQAIAGAVQQYAQQQAEQKQGEDGDLTKKARQRMDLENQVKAGTEASARYQAMSGPGMQLAAAKTTNPALEKAKADLAAMDAADGDGKVQAQQKLLEADDKALTFSDGKGYAKLHNGNVVINPASLMPDGMRPKDMPDYGDQIQAAVDAGDLTPEQGKAMDAHLDRQADELKDHLTNQALLSSQFKDWLQQKNNALFSQVKDPSNMLQDPAQQGALQDAAVQFLKSDPGYLATAWDAVKKTFQGLEGGSGIPTLIKGAGYASGIDFLKDMGEGLEFQRSQNDPRLENSLLGKVGEGLGSVGGFALPTKWLGAGLKAFGASEKAANLIALGMVNSIPAAESAGQIYSKAIASGLDKPTAMAAGTLSGLVQMTMMLPIAHVMEGWAAPMQNLFLQRFAKLATGAASFAAINATTTLGNNAIAKMFFDKDQDLFQGLAPEMGSGALVGLIIDAVSQTVGHVKYTALKTKYNLPADWKGKPEDLMQADAQISNLHLTPTTEELSRQRADLVTKLQGTTGKTADAIKGQIWHIDNAILNDPGKNVSAPERPTLAQSLLKLSQGTKLEDLSDTEKAVLTKAKTTAGVPFIQEHEGERIISDEAKQWLGNFAPHAAEMLGNTGKDARETIDARNKANGITADEATSGMPGSEGSQQDQGTGGQEGNREQLPEKPVLPVGKAGGLFTPKEKEASKGISDRLEAEGAHPAAAKLFGDYFVRRESTNDWSKDHEDAAVAEFKKAGGIENPQAIVASIKASRDSEGGWVKDQHDAIISELKADSKAEGEGHIDDLTDADQERLSKILKHRILPEASIYRQALGNIDARIDSNRTGVEAKREKVKALTGRLAVEKNPVAREKLKDALEKAQNDLDEHEGLGVEAGSDTLFLRIRNLLKADNFRYLSDDAVAERVLNEEVSHIAGIQALAESNEKRTGRKNPSKLSAAIQEGEWLFKQLPEGMRKDIQSIRGFEEGNESDGHSGMEFLRMVLQGDISLSKDGGVLDRKGNFITEQLLPKSVLDAVKGLVRRALERIVKAIRNLDTVLRDHLNSKNISQESRDAIFDHIKSLRERQLEIYKNFQKSGDEIRNEAYQKAYEDGNRDNRGTTGAEDDNGGREAGVGGNSEGVQSDGGKDHSGRVGSEDSGSNDAGTNQSVEGEDSSTSPKGDKYHLGGEAGPAGQRKESSAITLDNPAKPKQKGDWEAYVPKSGIAVRLHRAGPVELDDIQSSAGTELQPRNRSRVANREQEAEMAGKWTPGRSKQGQSTAEGPILFGKIDGKNVNLSGHGRQNAQRLIYDERGKGATKNRAWIKQEMKRRGYSPEEIAAVDKMKAPAWAAEVADLGDYNKNGAGLLGLVRDSNLEGMSKGELAASDANLLTRIKDGRLLSSLHVSEKGNILDLPQNKDSLDAIYKSFSSPRELKNEAGKFNKEFEARVRGAMLAYSIGPEHTDLITRLLEDSSGMKNLADGIMYAAPELAKSTAEGGIDIGQQILKPAVETLIEYKNAGDKFSSLAEFLNQDDFIRQKNPAADRLLEELAQRNRSAKQIGEFLSGITRDEAKKAGDANQYEGTLLARTANDKEATRLRKLQEKQRNSGLDKWETQELTNLEKRAGQSFMGLFDQAKNPEENFQLEQEIEQRNLPKAPAEQMSLLARRAGPERKRTAKSILEKLKTAEKQKPVVNRWPDSYYTDDEGRQSTTEDATAPTDTQERRGINSGLRAQEESDSWQARLGDDQESGREIPQSGLAPIRRVDSRGRDSRVVEKFKGVQDVIWDDLGLPTFEPYEHLDPDLQQDSRNHTTAEVKEGSPANTVLGMEPGTYSRSEFHDKIKEYFLNGGHDQLPLSEIEKPTPQENPHVLFLGGGGGSGKSSILKKEIAAGRFDRTGRVVINPDEVREFIPEYHALNEGRDTQSSAFTHEESSEIADEIEKEATRRRYHLIKDGTLKSEEKALGQFKEKRDQGYNSSFLGVTIDPHEAMVRAALRGHDSKRFVPNEVILNAHKGFNSAVAAYVRYFMDHGDQVKVVDNTPPKSVDLDNELVASGKEPHIKSRSLLDKESKSLDTLLSSYGQEKTVSDAPEAVKSRTAGTTEYRRDMESQVGFLKRKAHEAGYRDDLKDVPLPIFQNWAREFRDNNPDDQVSLQARRGGKSDDDGSMDLFSMAAPELVAYDKALEDDGITHPQAKAGAAMQDLGASAPEALDLFGNPLTKSKTATTQKPNQQNEKATKPRRSKNPPGRLFPPREADVTQDAGLGDLFSSLVGQREAERDNGMAGRPEGDLFEIHGQQDAPVQDGDSYVGDGSSGGPEGDLSDNTGGNGSTELGGNGESGGSAGTGSGGRGGRSSRGPKKKGAKIAQTGSGVEESRPPVGSPERNISLDRNDVLAPKGTVSKLKANLSAIRIIKALDEEGRLATEEEKRALVKFSGWGALSQAFDDEKAGSVDRGEIEIRRATAARYSAYGNSDYYAGEVERQEKSAQSLENWKNQWHEAHKELKELLSPQEYQTAKESTINAHYTSPKVVAAMWDAVSRLGFQGGNVLEPGAGIGHFLGLMPEGIANRSKSFAVEIDPFTSKILKALYPETDVQNKPFQNSDISDNSIDLAISNVPFANVPVSDEALKAMGGPVNNLHDYFFGKTLTKLKPGGVAAFITSAFTMDKGNAETRKWLSERADLLGAYRLPNDAFKENAGTDVTTDIIILRKKDGRPFEHGQSWQNLGDSVTQKGEPIRVNEYFARNPGNILGKLDDDGSMYGGKKEMTVHSDPANPAEIAIQQGISTLPEGIMGEIEAHGPVRTNALEIAKVGNIITGEDGKYYFSGQTEPDEALNNPDNAKRVQSFLDLRTALNRQYDLEGSDTATDEQIEENRRSLNRAYDDFTKSFKFIHDNKNKNLFIDDPDYFRLAGAELEKKPEVTGVDGMTEFLVKKRGSKEYGKADIFSKRVIVPRTEPAHAETIEDGMGISLGWRNHIDTQFIAELTGKTPEQVEKGLLDREIAFKDPSTGQLLSREEYLSGNVLKKLEVAEAAGPDYERNVKFLKEIQPDRISLSDVGYNIGATWVPEGIYSAFLDHLGYKGYKARNITTEDRSGWAIEKEKGSGTKWGEDGYKEFETNHISVPEMMDSLLNFKPITINTRAAKGESPVRDDAATMGAREKAKALNEHFIKWSQENEGVSKILEDAYNNESNGYADRTFDGQHLVFPWANKDFDIYPDKKNSVWRALQDGSGLIAHGVGGGKTIIGTAIALEMRRLGMAKKPMIVVHNATLEGFAKEITKMAPTARILIGRKDELSGPKRKEFLMRIAAGDWDAVMLAHSTFKTIKDDPQVIVEHSQVLVDEGLDALKERGYADLDAALEDNRKSPTVKAIVKQIQKMRKKIEDALKDNEPDGLLNFQQLGVDSLIVDEAHAFKKMPFYTNLDAKGIDGSTSEMGVNLLMRAREIQKKTGGKNIFAMTGTPITNTMGEIWNLLRLTSPNVLRDFGVQHFDQFHSKFADTVTDSEMRPNGDYKDVTRLSEFKNLPEWYRFLRAGADVKLGEDMVVKNRPEIKGGAPELVALDRSPGVSSWIQHIRAVLKAYDEMDPRMKKENPSLTAVPVQAYNASRAAAIDIRLIEPRAKEEAGSKLNEMVKKATDLYNRTNDYKGTQVIFADTINSGKTTTLDSVIPHDDIGIEFDPNHVPGSEFNLYDEIKRKLIANGIPANEIANIRDKKYNNDEAKFALFNAVNEGKVRIVIGSTQKLGTGVNMQGRMIAAHHLDAPWGPADLEQRDGRVYRQGNIHAEMGIPIEIYRYGMMDTLDSAIWQKLTTKQGYTYAGLSGRVLGRRMKEDSTYLNLKEQQAVLGGVHARRIFEINNRLAQLDLSRRANADEAESRKTEKAQGENHLRIFQEQFDRISPKLDEMQKLGQDVAENGPRISVGGKTFETKAETNEAIQKALEEARNSFDLNADGINHLKGIDSIEVNGKPIYLHPKIEGFNRVVEGEHRAFGEEGKMVPVINFELQPDKETASKEDLTFGKVSSPATLMSRLEELGETVDGIRTAKENNIESARRKANLPDTKPWQHQEEFDKLQKELSEAHAAYAAEIAVQKAAEKAPEAPEAPDTVQARRVKDDPDQLPLDFTKAVEDGEKSAAQRLRDAQSLMERETGKYSNMRGFEKDEAMQRARIAVAKASKAFDSSRGVPFEAYARQAIRNEMKGMYRQELTHSDNFKTIFDSPVGENGEETMHDFRADEKTPSASDDAISNEAKRVLDSAISELPERMQEAVRGFLDGDNGQQIADRMGVSRQAVNKLQDVAFRRMRGKLGEMGVADADSLLARAPGRNFKWEEGETSIDDLMKSLGDVGNIDNSKVSDLYKKAQAEEGGKDPYKVGTPKKAYSASMGPEGRAVDQDHQDKIDAAHDDPNNPRTQAAWYEGGAKLVKENAKATAATILRKAENGETLTPQETVAAQIISNRIRQEAASGGEGAFAKFVNFWRAYRQTGSAASDAMNARRDDAMTSADRHRSFLMDMLTKPSKATKDLIRNEKDPAKVREILGKETAAILEKLKAAGITAEHILKDQVTLKPIFKKMVNDFRSLLARATSRSNERKEAFDMILKNKSLDAISKATGLQHSEIQGIKDSFIARLRADNMAAIKAGSMKAEGEVNLGERKALSDEEAEKEFKKILEKVGIVPDKEQGKPKFNIEDPAHVKRMYAAIRELKGDSTLADKVYEGWVQNLLSAPKTFVRIIASNSAAVAWDLTVQRGMESFINLFAHDEHAASFGEFKYLVKGIIPSVAKAYNIAAKGWAAEHDFYKSTVLGTPEELDKDNYFSRSGGHIAGLKGRIIRVPGRAVLFTDHMFTTTYGHIQAGAEAYRIAKAEGLKGDAIAKRVEQLTKTRGDVIQEYMQKVQPSEEMVKFIAKKMAILREGVDVDDLIADRSSDAWKLAREQAAFDAAKADGWKPDAWEKAWERSQQITFKQDLKSKQEGGGTIENVARKIQDMRHDSKLVSAIFPFVRTPYNVPRLGIRKSPLGAVNLAYQIGKGLWGMKNGKPYLKTHPDLVRDISEQAIAYGACALLYGAAQGDKDDDDKKFLITGSPEMAETKDGRGTRGLNERAYGGGYQVRIGGRNGVTIPYGAIEPFAMVLGTAIDGLRAMKRKGTTEDNVEAFKEFVIGEIKNKSFLTGLATVSEMVGGREDFTGKGKKALLTALVPNLIRSPMRGLDDYVRDNKTANPLYDALPTGSLAQPKLNPYGEPLKKSGNPLLRVFVDTPLATNEHLHTADRLLLNWNHENPSEAWAPDSPKAVFKGKDGKEVQMTGEEATKFRLAAGRLAVNNLKSVVNARNMENPTKTDVEAVRQAFEHASTQAKALMLPSLLRNHTKIDS